MPALTDRYGLSLSTNSRKAAERYVEGVDRMLAYTAGIETELDAAITADAGFAMPHAAYANYWFFRGEPARARASAERAVALAVGATPREQSHAAILHLTVTGQAAKAAPLVDAHLREHPRDALILLQRLGAIFYNGGVRKREAMFELFASLARQYGDDWWFLTWWAFSHHEVDRFEDARKLAARALELRRDSGNGVHAMAHVHFETGENAGGAAFMEGWFGDFPEPGGFHTHLSWHHALFELAEGRPSAALAIYDRAVAPGAAINGGALGAVADAASFLWRCSIYGAVEQQPAWEPVAALAHAAFPRAGTVWVDVHKAMALAALADDAAIDALLDGLRRAAERGHPTALSLAAPVVEALRAFAQGAYGDAADGLESVYPELVALGGSNAQRDVFEETLAEAYLRSGRFDRAEAFLRKRLGRRTSARDLFRLARVQTARGESAAGASLAGAHRLWASAEAGAPERRALLALAR